jgi:RNA polymerase sigma-70 factor (ECF subfamily)
MPSAQWWKTIHRRILGGDKVAPAELAEEVLPLLERHVRASQKTRDADMIADAAVDAVMAYVKKPKNYDPSKRSLLGYLRMAAMGDLLNRRAKEGRRRDRAPGGMAHAVELDVSSGKKSVDFPQTTDDCVDPTHARVMALFNTEQDRLMAGMIIDSERSTAKFAAVLGITGRPIEEQRDIVKKHKDRLKKVLRRRGRDCHG